MNRLTLVLNTAILVVTFVVALTAGDVQGRLLTSATRAAGRSQGAGGPRRESSVTLLRVVQSMENFYTATPENPLHRVQLDAIREAIDVYESEIRSGLDRAIADSDGTDDLRSAVSQLGRSVRLDLEAILARSFDDPATVGRLTTEIIRNCN